MYGASFSRQIDTPVEEGQQATMEGVEHLGQYVYEMTKAKVEALKAGGGKLLAISNGEVNMEPAQQTQEDDEVVDREENVLVPEEQVDSDYPGPEEADGEEIKVDS